jgi:methylenetetrahydrofolate dehydrogenase (NADP+)/methenyltetrahydrofolate cyclohydrolase
MILLDGKATSKQIKDELKQKVAEIRQNNGKTPHLAVILVGENGASKTYVNSKIKACEYVGFKSTLVKYPEIVSEEELLNKIKEINKDDDIDGLIVQLPLPDHINEQKVIETIDYKKDVDGFHPVNAGRLMLGMPAFVPATPMGIMELLRRYDITVEGKNVVVLGRSHIVGRPMSILLSGKGKYSNGTVTLCHSKTKNLEFYTKNADIIVVALGKPEFLKGEMIKEGAVVIDVGITRVPDDTKERGYRLAGDVDFESVAPKTSYITPVPGGVGPMTIASLLLNTYYSATGKIYEK